MKRMLKTILGKRLWRLAQRWREKADWTVSREARRCFLRDCGRLLEHSSALGADTRGKALARLILFYHVAEKNWTMPDRRMGFGRDAVLNLMEQIEAFEDEYGKEEPQALHAVGVVRAYWELHEGWEGKSGDETFWAQVGDFVRRHGGVPAARQWHGTREEFFAARERPFPEFARSRHSVRTYGPEPVPEERIRAAVELATTAPSACNRQYARVHCVGGKKRIERILALQNGNRGFGHLADKLLLVTVDLEGIFGAHERNDLFTNGGMFLMNLSYALHWQGIAHCILNWSTSPENDEALRKELPMRESETTVALLTCGMPPAEFGVAASPRKSVSDVFVDHGAS
jgi:nitroreductase